MSTRRIKLRSNDQRIVLVIGVATGVGLDVRGLEPTGAPMADFIVLVIAAVAAVWASASAPWWALSGLAALGALLAPPAVPLVVGIGVFALSIAVRIARRSLPVERAVVAGGTILVLSTAREIGWWGLNTYVAVIGVAVVSGLGIRRRPGTDRRIAFAALGVAATVVALGVLGFAATATAARPDLTTGNRAARQGLRHLEQGNFDAARQAFVRAAAAFERAERDIGAVWTQPARLIPVASQHRRAGIDVSGAAAQAADTVARQLREVDIDAIRPGSGQIDIGAVEALQSPMAEVHVALGDLGLAVRGADNGWLAAPFRERLAELDDEIGEQLALGSKAIDALDVAPAMLGADGERVYLVMFTTPAEARGMGGFMGNYAEITIDDGAIEMTDFGTDEQLNRRGDRPRTITGPQDWLDRYGQFGFVKGPDEVVGDVPWKNITMSPHFPSTGAVSAALYPQSGGRPVDAIIGLDVYALQAIIGLVGPIDVPRAPRPLTGRNAADYLLVGQYELERSTPRRNALETVAESSVDGLLGPNAPSIIDLGRALAPLVPEQRVVAWADRPDEQALIESVGLDAALLGGNPSMPGLAVDVVNASGNKIDSFLRRSYVLTLETQDAESVRALLEIELTNNAPTTGYPNHVIGNEVGLPTGTNLTLLTVTTPWELRSATREGDEQLFDVGTEVGANTYSAFVEIPSGATAHLELELVGLAGPLILLDPQPLTEPERWKIDATAIGGDVEDLTVRTLIEVALDPTAGTR